MVELRTLGMIELSRGGRELRPVLRQPKRLALLIWLAVSARKQFCRRDTLLGVFWPELDSRHARHALSQSLHWLSAQLGADLFERRGVEEVRLRAGSVRCDVVDFEHLLAVGDAAGAMALYGGDFLDGFYLSDSAEFEHWVQAERARVRVLAARAGWAAADRSLASDQTQDAKRAARWAEALEPFDDTATQRLIRMLDASGDRAGAVQAHDAFVIRLARELDLEPTAETTALAALIRSRHALLPWSPVSPSDNSHIRNVLFCAEQLEVAVRQMRAAMAQQPAAPGLVTAREDESP